MFWFGCGFVVWGLVHWVNSVVARLGGSGGVESVVLVWVCDCFFSMGLWRVVQGWVAVALGCGFFFFFGNFGGDRRVWLSFGGWCCMGLPERDKPNF